MEEGRQQRALSPCVIWTRQEYALMFPMVEISVLFSCRTRWLSVLADDRRFFSWCAGNAQHPYISQAMTVWTEAVSFP